MKRTVALAIIGLSVAAISNVAQAQGHANIWAYSVAPYNQVLWDAGVPGVGGTAVNDTSVQLNIWFAPGVVADPGLLTETSPAFTLNPGLTYNGGGFYDPQTLVTAAPGTYTIQIRASGDASGSFNPGDTFAGGSGLFQIDTITTANPAPLAPISPQVFVDVVPVPEPTTFALAGLGAAALLIFRRRD